MFTTELVHRVILTVLLLGALGNCGNEQEQDQLHHHHEDQVKRQEKQQQQHEESQNLSSDKDDTLSFSSSSSPLSRSIPSFETRNYHDYYRNRYYRNRDSSSSSYSSPSPYHPFESERPDSQSLSSSTLSSVNPEMSTVISSTSYSIKPDSSGSGSNVYINTKPTPFIISRHPTTTNSNSHANDNDNKGSSFSSYFPNSNPRRGGSSSSSSSASSNWEGDQFNNDCFNGRNCPKGDDDEYKTYYSVLNGRLKYPERLGGASGASLTTRGRYEDERRESQMTSSSSGNPYYDRQATFPFHVHGIGPLNKHRFYANPDDNYPKRRVTRTSTTSSPSWVKLQPIPSHKFYDPFLAKDKDASSSNIEDLLSSGNEKYENVQFANRIGIELSPESFAERWGYGNGNGAHSGASHVKSSSSGGSRLPSWLEELNHHHKLHHHHLAERRPYSGPTRDEDPKNWVKLDPIPVAGVSISKWVPKGTASSDLPSTGNLIRDKPSAWWDRSPHLKPPTMGWGSSSSFNNRYPPPPHETKRPNFNNNDPWKDIIYPDTPSSATASWEANIGSSVLKGPSSFPSSSSSSGGGWTSETRRPSIASWTAPLTSSASSTNRFSILRPGAGNSNGGGHQIPSNYPDPQANDDDPRWVLVSNSRRVSLAGQQGYSDRHKYRPPIHGYRDDLDDLSSYEPELERERDRISYYKSHRLAKDYKYSASKDLHKNPAQRQQDEAFQKVNATLQQLTPVLNHLPQHFDNYDSSSSSYSSDKLTNPERRLQTTTEKPTTTTTTTARPPVTKPSKFSFLSALIGDGRGSSMLPTFASKNVANKNATKSSVVNRKGSSMKPILAAVGAGMIPATLAAVIPMMGRRKKRHTEQYNYQQNPSLLLQTSKNSQTPIVFRNKLYLISSNLDSTAKSFSEKSRMNGYSLPHQRFTMERH